MTLTGMKEYATTEFTYTVYILRANFTECLRLSDSFKCKTDQYLISLSNTGILLNAIVICQLVLL